MTKHYETGDIRESDGAVKLESGRFATKGEHWVLPHQAGEAERHGWKRPSEPPRLGFYLIER